MFDASNSESVRQMQQKLTDAIARGTRNAVRGAM